MHTRDEVRAVLTAVLEPLPYAHAAWEGGSTAFGRDDEFSDLDLHLVVDDDRVEHAFAVVEAELVSLGGVALHYRVPEPTWHGHSQAFYRIEEGAPHFVIDLIVMRRSSQHWFLSRERHGEPVVLFDKLGTVEAEDVDPAEEREVIGHRLRRIEVLIPMFADFVQKDLRRGNKLGALSGYQGFVLRPLVELLGIRYCPERSDFGIRYAMHDLPADVVERLERLWFVPDAGQIEMLSLEALAWADRLLHEIDAEGIAL